MYKKFLHLASGMMAALVLLQGCQTQESAVKDSDVLRSEKIAKNSSNEIIKDTSSETNVTNHTSNIKYETNGISTPHQVFPNKYTNVEGILTFRGNNMRDSPTYGYSEINNEALEKIWSFNTGRNEDWGGGAGWTGQPAIVHWDDEIRQLMNIHEEFKEKDLVEVIQASLDGNIYFFDLDSGKQTREPIVNGNPIKGSVSVDSRGYPLLYVGEGIPEKETIGFNLYSLIDHSILFHGSGLDPFAYRGWGASDGSALFNRDYDTLILGGENGLIYNYKLNTTFDSEKGTIAVNPTVIKYRYAIDNNTGNPQQGIESSLVAYDDTVLFTDNGGSVQALNVNTMKPKWALAQTDDTDSTPVLEISDGTPYLYTGTEVDNIGHDGNSKIRKIHGITGEILWEREYPAFYHKEVNGGILATPVVGKHGISNLIIFTIARVGHMESGLMVALDKESGEEIWKWKMPYYSWSSPIDVYTDHGKGYLLQGDAKGTMHLLNAMDGSVITTLELGANIESSPAVYKNIMVVPTRGGQIQGIELK